MMDANALKKLTRNEIQKLAQREKLRVNARTSVIINQLMKKYPGGVPALQPPAIQGSPVRKTTVESEENTVEKEINLSETNGVATMTQSTMNTSKTAETKKTDIGHQSRSKADSASMFVCQTNIESGSTKPSGSNQAVEKGTCADTKPSGVCAIATTGVLAGIETSSDPTSSSSPERRGVLVPAFDWEKASARGVHQVALAGREGPESPETTAAPSIRPAVGRRDESASRAARCLSSASGARGRELPSSDNPLYSTSSSSVPDRATPSQTQEGDYPREARIKELLQKIAEKSKEASYWNRVLEDTKETLNIANAENKKLSKQRQELERRRKVAERCFMMLKKRMNGDGGNKEVSDEAPTSDFVATSCDSSVEGETSAMKDLRAVCRGKKVYFGKQRMVSDSD